MSKGSKGRKKFKPLKAADVRDRVTEMRKVPAGTLRSHPLNWREHPDKQRAAMRDLLNRKRGGLGFVKPVDAYIAREGDAYVTEGKLKAGDLVLMDGHLRTEELPPDFMVSVNVTDLDEGEAKLYLATCDPLSALADQDDAKLTELLSQCDSDSAAVQDMLSRLLPDLGSDDDEDEEEDERTFQSVVTHANEEEQRAFLERALLEGLDVKALVA